MIKRDTIQRCRLTVIEDEQGGSTVTGKEPLEIVRASVSVGATMTQIAEFGASTALMLNVVTDIKLDEYIYTRYMFSGKLFRLMRQIKRGNEYFSTLLETTE